MLPRLRKLDGKQSTELRDSVIREIKSTTAGHLRVRNQAESRLLRLPSELLVNIAKLVWPDDDTEPLRFMARFNRIARVDSDYEPSYCEAKEKYEHETALLRTCSRLRVELSSTFLASKVFEIIFEMKLLHYFNPRIDLTVGPKVIAEDMHQWLDAFPTQAWTGLRQIRVHLQDSQGYALVPRGASVAALDVERKIFGAPQKPPRVYIGAFSLRGSGDLNGRCWVNYQGEHGMMDENGSTLSAEDGEVLYDC